MTAKGDARAWDRAWVSYWSASVIRGTGAMKHAVRAVCDWALGEAERKASSSIDCSVLEKMESPRLRRLELGYRTNNPASGKVARYAGFVVEGIEREKFLYAGQTYDAVTAARLRGVGERSIRSSIHHVELWTRDFAGAFTAWNWLLLALGAEHYQEWPDGYSWQNPDGSYVVLEQSLDVEGALNRCNAGMNHVALTVGSVEDLNGMRTQAQRYGWNELFADKFPHAGGEEHAALYLENEEGFEVEIVWQR